MWSELSYEWQVVFEEAWVAFKMGSVPIGAAVFDEFGRLIVRDHNRWNEVGIPNRFLAHAETNAIRQLRTDAEYNIRTCVMYVTMEPCSMCLGTIDIGNIKHLKYAAKDRYNGAAEIPWFESRIRKKNHDYKLIGGEMEFVQHVLYAGYELSQIERGSGTLPLKALEDEFPDAAALAKKLHEAGVFEQWKKEEKTMEFAYDEILRRGHYN